MIQRAYEEGEEQLIDDAEDADDLKDEKVFLLDESLKFRSTSKDGENVFAWRDLSGVRLNLFFCLDYGRWVLMGKWTGFGRCIRVCGGSRGGSEQGGYV